MAILSFGDSSPLFEAMQPHGSLTFDQGGEEQHVTGADGYSPNITAGDAASWIKLRCAAAAMAGDGSMSAPAKNSGAQWFINAQEVTEDQKRGYAIDFEDSGRVLVVKQNIAPDHPLTVSAKALIIDPRDGSTLTYDCGSKNLHSVQLLAPGRKFPIGKFFVGMIKGMLSPGALPFGVEKGWRIFPRWVGEMIPMMVMMIKGRPLWLAL